MLLNQTALWTPLDHYGDHGDPVYKAAVSIKVRKQVHSELIKDAHGNTLLTKNIIYTTADVQVGDSIDGERVLTKYVMYSLGGSAVVQRLTTV